MFEALYDADMGKVADRWATCADRPITKIKPAGRAKLPENAEMVLVCRGNHNHDAEVVAQTCDLRICPDCARRHAARLAARYTPKMLELLHQHHPSYRFRLVTFTLPFSLEDADIEEKFDKGFDQVYRVMDEMMSKNGQRWKEKQGYTVGAEFGSEGLKLHYHAIHYGQYLDQGELSRRWFTATDGKAEIVDVRAMVSKKRPLEESVKEVFKYCVKFFRKDKKTGEFICIPAHFMPMLSKVLEGSRRVRTYGVFYNVPEPESVPHTCESCGSEMVGIPVDYWLTYCNTGMLPNEFWKANREAVLNSKPADKSPEKSTAGPPKIPDDIRKRQIEMDVIKKMRWQAKDEF